jgi:hypothetical protein
MNAIAARGHYRLPYDHVEVGGRVGIRRVGLLSGSLADTLRGTASPSSRKPVDEPQGTIVGLLVISVAGQSLWRWQDACG